MAEGSQSQRPRLEHRQSQTIIDLTDDVDEAPAANRNPSQRRPARPPQLGRSDGSRLQDFIDLTDESDIIFTGARQLPPRPPRPIAAPRPPRTPSPPLFVPARPQAERVNGVGLFTGAVHHMGVGGVGALRNFLGLHVYQHEHFHAPPPMPGPMDYQYVAFGGLGERGGVAGGERKPEHIAPPSVPEGFTRSPVDENIVICPSCEEELIHRKEDEEQPPAKKGGKAPTRKDREEHPFWVVKECGHVRESGSCPMSMC